MIHPRRGYHTSSLFTIASPSGMLRVSLLRGVWGERVLTSGGALLRTTVCFLGLVGVVWVVPLAGYPAGGGQGCDLVIAVGDHFPLSSVHSFSLSRHAACFVAGWGSGENGSSHRAGPSSGRQWFLGIVSLITFHFPLSTVHSFSPSRYAERSAAVGDLFWLGSGDRG